MFLPFCHVTRTKGGTVGSVAPGRQTVPYTWHSSVLGHSCHEFFHLHDKNEGCRAANFRHRGQIQTSTVPQKLSCKPGFNGLSNFGSPEEQASKLLLTEGDALTCRSQQWRNDLRNLATQFFWTLLIQVLLTKELAWLDLHIHYCIQSIVGASAHNDMTMLCLTEDLTLTQQEWL